MQIVLTKGIPVVTPSAGSSGRVTKPTPKGAGFACPPGHTQAMKTNFYIDGFNLYYGSLKGTTFRWLDLVQLCQKCFPDDEVHRIRYFTACVKPTPSNPHQAVRQQIYLRALRTLPPVEIHLGKFLIKSVTLPLSAPVPGEPDRAEVLRAEEKGSDVNLASYLLLDAFDDAFEKAVVVTNDSDLVTPVRIVRERFDKPVVVLFPCRRSQDPSYDLSKVASASPRLHDSELAASQFPADMRDAKGPFHKPPQW